jgi:hypothetical protein
MGTYCWSYQPTVTVSGDHRFNHDYVGDLRCDRNAGMWWGFMLLARHDRAFGGPLPVCVAVACPVMLAALLISQ